ncbi:MAG: hypothetical protein HY964_08770 [Ignavibacteriales bacterium]|nr:hypothetical protein [Ignavibacteriales bacterium]
MPYGAWQDIVAHNSGFDAQYSQSHTILHIRWAQATSVLIIVATAIIATKEKQIKII